ncbi:MAG: cyclase family protein [Butyrivibrio sp.]|nr:cyclase family protein [Butyrivibrio sp.]
MKIYDISQEVFGCVVFPGDPAPERKILMKISDGAVCNLTAFSMCAHNGTHVDAPYHFYEEGKKIDEVALNKFVGYAYMTECEGDISAKDAQNILSRAKEASKKAGASVDADRRILIKGKAVLTEEAARIFADEKILLYANESQTVGPEDAPKAVHLIMLGAEIVLLEGIRLSDVEEGIYVLNAAPINLGESDGAPCRAILMEI